MKIVAIGDLHGKNYWKKININEYDKIVFLGDYVDHWTETNESIYTNLLEIIEFKKAYPEKVILILGNHDVQYLHFPKFTCSGFRKEMQASLTELFRSNIKSFQIAFQIKNYLFTHAGVCNYWFNWFKTNEFINNLKGPSDNLADWFNKVEQTNHRWILHAVGAERGGGQIPGITWADLRETATDYLKGYHQIVGHTLIKDILQLRDDSSSITYVDILDHENKFYELEI